MLSGRKNCSVDKYTVILHICAGEVPLKLPDIAETETGYDVTAIPALITATVSD